MPQKMKTDQFKLLVKLWYETDGVFKSDAQLLLERTVPITVGGRKFILAAKFITASGYPVVLGFYEDTAVKPKLHCRHFYRSNSESAWRVGTGFRDNGAWVKGAEGHAKAMSGGYIFEGQVHHVLDKALQDMALTIEHETDKGFNPFDAAKALVPSTYMVQTQDACSRVINEYAEERQQVTVLPKAVWEDDPDLKGNPKLLQKSQPHFQQNIKDKVQSLPSSNNKANPAAWLKKSDKLWTFLNECLKDKIDTYTFPHVMLGEQCTVDRFRLGTEAGNVCIELAYSEQKSREFKTNSGVTCSINSPICWVKSAYFSDAVSTYGNYLKYPKDLCFLVQKPMDYVSQTTAEVNKRMGVAVKQGDKLRVRDVHTNIRDNIRKGGTYLMLALYDEKYSPLIQQYKAKKGFPLFKWKSQKFMKSGAEVAIKKIFKESASQFDKIKQDVLGACDDYLALPNANGHTERGKEKARTFKTAVAKIGTYAELDKAVYQLFAKNNIETTSYYLVKIRVKDNSLFSIFCKRMLPNYFELDVMHEVCRGDEFTKVIDKVYAQYKGTPLANSALERMALAAMKNQLISKGSSLVETERQQLLDAVKDV